MYCSTIVVFRLPLRALGWLRQPEKREAGFQAAEIWNGSPPCVFRLPSL
ncbi:hypothetical protein [Kingella oralis]|nr:hypothetical protein [Kingella oralis]